MDEFNSRIARMFCIGFEGASITSELRDVIQRGVSSVILFTRNYQSPAQLAELCCEIKSLASSERSPSDGGGIMICIDQEGGRVQRLREPFTIIPSMREIGRRNDSIEARKVGRVMARELRAVNIDMNLAPVLDVDSNPHNPVIGERSFGSDPHLVARMGCALIDGLQSSGMAACGKHFPGHGDTSIDSHLDLPRLIHDIDRLKRVDLLPFAAAIKSGVSSIMCAHVLFDALDPEFPATMSAAVIDQLLRKQMKFDGVVCSDDLEMKAIIDHYGIEDAVVRGASAGVDLFFVCKEHELQYRAIDALSAAVKRGDVSTQRIKESNRRLDALFETYVRPGSRWSERSVTMFSSTNSAAR
jgi:beta-N-acetylhexosaminidase